MRCKIHRGCHEIGGNCVEVESQGKRIILDIGLPLKNQNAVSVPDIDGLTSLDDTLLGVFISHPHPDHYGLLQQITQPVPVYMGEAAARIIDVSSFFTPLPPIGTIEPRRYSATQPVHLGPFHVTPLRIDHSAYDSYCLLVEAEGKRLLYTGDIRGHGRSPRLFQELVSNPPPDIDVLICEGTQLGRDPEFSYPNEHSVADRMVEIVRETKGMCLVWCSSQNIDRLISVSDAAQRSERQLILDMYTAEIARAVNYDALPTPGKDGVKVFLPQSQKSRIKREKAFQIPRRYYAHRIYPEQLREAAHRSVMIFRPSMFGDLKRAQCLEGATLITSLWSGYVRRSNYDLKDMDQEGIRRLHVHTSGHATVEELRQFVQAMPASRIVPIHLEDREAFVELSNKVELRNDHEWWCV